MIKSKYNIIGVMSGTSLDGIDLAYISFDFDKSWKFSIHYTDTISYDNYWNEKLLKLVSLNQHELQRTDLAYTSYISKVINQFIYKYQIKVIDAICSHGHTALHQPDIGLTYQIGNLPKLAQLLKQQIVCDFRVQDVELGGQGAPLVPIGDRLLFSDYDYCINLGGFANVSFENNNERLAYDICPVNIVMNYYANQLGFDYDEDGNIAKSGHINFEVLDKLNALEFYKLDSPKSLGLEWVENYIFPILEVAKLSNEDSLRTFTEHIAIQVSSSIKPNSKVLFTGGGVYNTFLTDRIKGLNSFDLIIPSDEIIQYKEALIFGLLGVLKLRNDINCLSSVTGASHDHSSGKIFTYNT
ncbi:anhydro-N-acetylmuramic acid kinase [uncultured Psychroserpens sp.]|uniref:anhydro-N-acetylmuramic acid kinase n=1 Tax=uncultured Psychroserpens sp. TaxID=255436 RepID=UPI00261C1944|nr:anhydro-N-acetylmuramic acid kinase [uncultured Psychroserpens sp.]